MADLLASVSLGREQASDGNDGQVLGLTQIQLENIKEHAIAWAAAHGMLIRLKGTTENLATFTHVPLSLLPVQIPRVHFEHGISLSPIYGLLVDRVARDLEWLHSTLASVVHEDQFTARLVALSKQMQTEGIQQQTYLGVHRSDYLLHEPQSTIPNDTQRLLQVELNTISSSFACIGSLASQLHEFLIQRVANDLDGPSHHYNIPVQDLLQSLPKNEAILQLPAVLAAAHQQYDVPNAVLMMVVQPNEGNSIDQRWIEYNLWTDHKIRVIRKTLAEVQVQGQLHTRVDGKRVLMIEGQEVSVSYFRAGYTPNDHPTEREWQGRELIERSYAIKCPSIAYHLAGTKKVQQALASPSVLRRFLSDTDATALETSFAGLWGLEKDSSEIQRIKQMAIQHAHGYVLKPQREGGGNNFYGAHVAHAMETMTPTELESYILMERIFPKEQPAVCNQTYDRNNILTLACVRF